MQSLSPANPAPQTSRHHGALRPPGRITTYPCLRFVIPTEAKRSGGTRCQRFLTTHVPMANRDKRQRRAAILAQAEGLGSNPTQARALKARPIMLHLRAGPIAGQTAGSVRDSVPTSSVPNSLKPIPHRIAHDIPPNTAKQLGELWTRSRFNLNTCS